MFWFGYEDSDWVPVVYYIVLVVATGVVRVRRFIFGNRLTSVAPNSKCACTGEQIVKIERLLRKFLLLQHDGQYRV